MNRKEFIKTCGLACLSAGSISLLLQSCTSSKIVSGQILEDSLLVPLSDFEVIKENKKTFRKYIVIQNERLEYPIYIFRFNEAEYTALYMQCTHQGNELSAYGDKLVCSAHGSEFDNRGNVTNSPADKPLKSFQVTIKNNSLNISLKAS